jgi:hypothetical protein
LTGASGSLWGDQCDGEGIPSPYWRSTLQPGVNLWIVAPRPEGLGFFAAKICCDEDEAAFEKRQRKIANATLPAPDKKKPRRTGDLNRGFWVPFGETG